MKDTLERIRISAKELADSCSELKTLEDIRVRFLGKKGELITVLRGMGALSADERPIIGALANQVRTDIEKAIDNKKKILSDAAAQIKLKAERIDVTMPGKVKKLGKKHPLTQVLDEIKVYLSAWAFKSHQVPRWSTTATILKSLTCPRIIPREIHKIPFTSLKIFC